MNWQLYQTPSQRNLLKGQRWEEGMIYILLLWSFCVICLCSPHSLGSWAFLYTLTNHFLQEVTWVSSSLGVSSAFVNSTYSSHLTGCWTLWGYTPAPSLCPSSVSPALQTPKEGQVLILRSYVIVTSMAKGKSLKAKGERHGRWLDSIRKKRKWSRSAMSNSLWPQGL